jgi:hypothetical protein
MMGKGRPMADSLALVYAQTGSMANILVYVTHIVYL